MIEEYKFGIMTIDGKDYNFDLEVDWEGNVFDWSKEEGRIIDAIDVKDAVDKRPETIVIGTGRDGVAEVTEDAQFFIRQNGIKLMIDKTEEAVKTFNILKEDSLEEEGRQCRVVGLFHLTG